MTKYFSLILLSIFLITCKGNSPQIKKAKEVTTAFLQALKQGDYTKVDQYYANSIYKSITKEEWVSDIKALNDLVGEIVSFELVQSEVISGTVEVISLEYEVSRTKFPTRENFFLQQFNQETRIVTHEISNKNYNASMVISTEEF